MRLLTPTSRDHISRRDDAAAEVVGAVFSFAIFGVIILLAVLSFVHLQEVAAESRAEHSARSAAQQVAQAVVTVGLLVEDQTAPPAGAVRIEVDLPERIAGREYTVQLEPGGTVVVRVSGLGVAQRAALAGMESLGPVASPTAWTLCFASAPGGPLAVVFDAPGGPPPATGCAVGSIHLIEASL